MSRKCLVCGSRWPAMVTVEAYNNRRRMHRLHEGERCHDEHGEFGPPVR